MSNFIDLDSGNDCSNVSCGTVNPDLPYGSSGNPRRSIPQQLESGDVVHVWGVGDPGTPLAITALGSCDAPIFIRGPGPTAPAVLQRGLKITGNYVIVEHIEFAAWEQGQSAPPTSYWFQVTERELMGSAPGSTTSVGPPLPPLEPPNPAEPPIDTCYRISEETDSTFVAIRHCFFHDHATGVTRGQSGGVFAMLFGATHDSANNPGNATAGTSDCVAYDTLVYNFGDWQAACYLDETPDPDVLRCPTDYLGCVAEGNSERTWMLDSVFHHLQSSGAGLSRNNALGNQRAARNGYIGRNVIHHTREPCIQVKFARDVIVTENKLSRTRGTGTINAGAAVLMGNNDHCDENENVSGDYYSGNVWVIFNHIYDVQTGVNAHQEIHCGGDICCCPSGGGDGCCGTESPQYSSPLGDPPSGAELYVVGNVFHHILSFLAEDDTRDPTNFGQAVSIGNQVQAWLVNNTISGCMQGVKIGCTNTGECPPGEHSANRTRNTKVTVVNNVMLNMAEREGYFADVNVCTGPSSGPFTLTDGELGFGHNLHFGANRAFRIPSAPPPLNYYDTIESLFDDDDTDYGIDSYGDLAAHNPLLVNPANLLFDQTASSPGFMSTTGVKAEAYVRFEELIGDGDVFANFPHIYRDYDGHPYSGNQCAVGAYKKE